MKRKVLFVTAFIFASCVQEKLPGPERIISIDPDQTETIKLSSIISEVEYLKLSTKDVNDLIGDIYHLEVKKDRIYVLDAFNSVTLNIYDRTGALLFNISNQGRGPGEFLGPYAFSVDEEENHIIIYDGAGLKLCYYDLNNGKFLNEKGIDFAISRFTVTDQHYIFYLNNMMHTGYKYNVIITDKKLNIIDRKLEMNAAMANYNFEFPVNFSTDKKNVFLTIPADYNIYRIELDNNVFEKYITIDFGKRNLPESFYEKHENNQSRFAEIGRSAHNISGFFETDRFLFFNYDVGEGLSQQYYFESKKEGHFIHTNYDKLEYDRNIGPLPRWPRALTGNKLVWPQQPSTLLRYIETQEKELTEVEWLEFKRENEKLISFSKTISKEDNPYLIFTEIDF